MTRFPATLLLLSGLAACAGTRVADVRTVEVPPSAAVEPVHAPAAPAPTPAEPLTAPASDGLVTPGERALWEAPAFQQLFAQGFLSETEIEPSLAEEDREVMQQVLQLMSSDQSEKARALLVKENGPARGALLDFTLGSLYFQREEFGPAADAYRTATDKFPKFRRAWQNLGLCRFRLEQFSAAAPALRRVIELGGGNALSYGLLGFCYTTQGDDLAAESAYRMANLLDPSTQDWRLGLAKSLFRQRRFADAAALFGGMLSEAPERSDLWLHQANAYIGLNQPMLAAQNFELVDRMGKSTSESLSTLADIYVNQELYDLAGDCYARALDMTPPASSERVLRAAKVLAARGAHDESRELVASLKSTPGIQLSDVQQKELLKLEARFAVAAGAGEEEARVLEEIVALDPLDGEALVLLGRHYRRAGDNDRAVFTFERAASIEAFEVDAKLAHAELLVGLGKYAEALPLLRRAQELKPRENVQAFLEQVQVRAQAR
jgi:tetratricopeptide (TPR) repeat protein